MSIEQEIKGIIDNALASHTQSKEVEELRQKVENLIVIVKSLVEDDADNDSAINDDNFKIKQGEAFISPATISGEISCSRESLGKELQKAITESINQQSQVKGSPLWNAINGDRAGNWESKSDPRLMKEQHDKTMIINISEDGLTITHNGQMATYWKNGNKRIFSGYDENKLPERIFFHDSRAKHTRSE